jgi:hypothetical protein
MTLQRTARILRRRHPAGFVVGYEVQMATRSPHGFHVIEQSVVVYTEIAADLSAGLWVRHGQLPVASLN